MGNTERNKQRERMWELVTAREGEQAVKKERERERERERARARGE